MRKTMLRMYVYVYMAIAMSDCVYVVQVCVGPADQPVWALDCSGVSDHVCVCV